ncbi:MAG TPA: hypothetical protein DCZ95_13930 [Verrucomicrobia bacterium]|nr:hypothetical protein [Verrucomicrobiota bacterium]
MLSLTCPGIMRQVPPESLLPFVAKFQEGYPSIMKKVFAGQILCVSLGNRFIQWAIRKISI